MGKNYENMLKKIIFPLILLGFPLLKIAMGVGLADTGFSLGNYRFFPAAEGTWVLNTYLSNITGYLFTRLPFGGRMIGMNFYTALFVSAMALIGYRFFITKMPPWVAFLGEMTAIGLCWCPTVILYNYMTYFFFLLGAVLLFRGLVGERTRCLVLAGVCLGLNFFVRNPNVLEAALILCLWYYGILRRKSGGQISGETLACAAGYFGALAVMTVMMMVHYGVNAPAEMIGGLFSIAGRAEDYTLWQMAGAIIDAYLHGLRWLLYPLLGMLAGTAFFMVWPRRLVKSKKVLYCLATVFLFFVLGRWGMYNFKYYQKEAALQWAVIFLLLALGNMVWMLFSGAVDAHWKLIASIGIVVILITPLGSNNHVWPIINNLFFIAPVMLWMVYKWARWGKEYLAAANMRIPLFPVKAMQAAIMAAVVVQSLGIGSLYTFNDGENGIPRDTPITGNKVARGMYTTRENAANLEEISAFVEYNNDWQQQSERRLILYGNIPALSYYLDLNTAISSSWPDLDSSSAELLAEELKGLDRQLKDGGDRPLVIINAKLSGAQQNSTKKHLLDGFMADNGYREVFRNEQFVAWL